MYNVKNIVNSTSFPSPYCTSIRDVNINSLPYYVAHRQKLPGLPNHGQVTSWALTVHCIFRSGTQSHQNRAVSSLKKDVASQLKNRHYQRKREFVIVPISQLQRNYSIISKAIVFFFHQFNLYSQSRKVIYINIF